MESRANLQRETNVLVVGTDIISQQRGPAKLSGTWMSMLRCGKVSEQLWPQNHPLPQTTPSTPVSWLVVSLACFIQNLYSAPQIGTVTKPTLNLPPLPSLTTGPLRGLQNKRCIMGDIRCYDLRLKHKVNTFWNCLGLLVNKLLFVIPTSAYTSITKLQWFQNNYFKTRSVVHSLNFYLVRLQSK